MGEYPKGGIIGKAVHLGREVAALKISLYAANASFFMVLAVFPALLLLLGLLRYTPLEVERLGELLQGILPEALLEPAEELILLTYDKTTGFSLGLSAVTVLWSASRGIYGLQKGLNAVYGVSEGRGYLHTRFLCLGYTFVFLVVLLLTLGLEVFGSGLVELLKRTGGPFLRFLLGLVDLRFFLLLALQTGLFTAMFCFLPNQRSPLRQGLPGALLASVGWLVFSDLFSVYVEHFAGLPNVYGSVYGIALSMLWLYCCVSIVFYGGALNVFLKKWK